VGVPRVVLDRGRADEQLRRGLTVGVTLDDQPGDLGFLRRQRQGRFRSSGSRMAAGGLELGPGPLGEALGAHAGERVGGGAELVAGLPAAALAPQPLPVDQVAPRQVGRRVGAAQHLDRPAVLLFCLVVRSEQRPAAGEAAEAQSSVSCGGPGGQATEGGDRLGGLAGSSRCLDEVGQHERA